VVKVCPHCSSADIKYFGIGTETVATECRKLFPGSKIIRFDSDTAGRTREYEDTVYSFRKHEADILVGTQIVAKGLNFPLVSLVGAVNADIGLNLPDFRSGERTFQLLCQVAGRAGRGKFAGSAVIQTYNPGYYAIKFAARHDYAGFYDSEIKYRRSYGYPPFNDMIRLVYSHANEDKCRAEADRVHKLIKTVIDSRGLPGYKLIGPVATHIARLRGQYQIQIILLGKGLQDILSAMNFPRGWVLDVDPLGMI
jgi:primosomal protein N' (replication factor Y)